MKKIYGVLTAAVLLFCGAMLFAQDQEMRIELLGSLGTRTSHKGDRIFGRIVEPSAYKGDSVEGQVREARSGSKLRGGGAVLNFSFNTLQHAGQSISITTQVKSFYNSQGKADVDEEGRIVRSGGGNGGKAIAGTAAGGLIGGLTGGWKGAAIGTAVGTASSIAVIEITADAPDIRFEPGSTVTVSVRTHDGQPLNATSTAAWSTAPTNTASAASLPQAAPAAQTASAAATTNAPEAAAAQLNFTSVKNDYVPGDKLILFDDFSDVQPGESLPRWKSRGCAADVQQAGAVHQLTLIGPDCSSTLAPLINGGLPANFTVDLDMVNSIAEGKNSQITWHFRSKADSTELKFFFDIYPNLVDLEVSLDAPSNGESYAKLSNIPFAHGQAHKIAIWLQNGRLRFYLDGKRLVDANQVNLPALGPSELESILTSDGANYSIRNVRFAESTPDISKTIFANGRFVTYGIQFDTDSDRIKDDSAATIQSVAKVLQNNPTLRLRIEGHTDATGQAAHNMDLSKRRAEAVKSVLVAQFQIDASRLDTAGLGSTKPVASNDDADGRAKNRRVEFVKE